ncbi:MAG TPA: polyhydroxyalkanoate synthesis repressor PhaR [Candidatus Marinimicrobia bacterium]|jgi:polyhydroxyalkanoate synthesis repressor PhaR|nr:polyhydroxyalkanoate synthesis repressor PhaR [Candidatus Neomarinimicrobiota bacterium]HJL63610.1 polyhydroxyalkanoate synthesis repressor PhaR [Candidatus Neomarinimicrobiota bacterium]
MPKERLIKKYPNRRLYDTSTSCYITLDEVRNLVVEGIPFKVVEKKTNEDLTRNILLQIIMDYESGDGEPMFSIDLLIRFIRNYGESSQDSFKSYMEQSMEFFTQQQDILKEQLTKPKIENPVEAWMDMGKKQFDLWQQAQKQFFNKPDK